MKNFEDKNLGKRSPFRQSRANKGKLINKSGNISEKAETAVAVSVIGNTVIAVIKENQSNTYLDCTVSGRIVSPHQNSTLVAVGDSIGIIRSGKIASSGLETARVVSVNKRLNKLSRKAAGKGSSEHVIGANFDILFILAAALKPEYNKRFIDRLLLAAEIGGVQPVIGINKMDLAEEKKLIEDDLYIYNKIKVPVYYFSALKNSGIDEIKNLTKNKITLFFGPSGVGKSTLINRLIGESLQKINIISDRTNKGQHTTSFVKMLELPYGGNVIDSPGVREFAVWDIDKLNLALHFHDFDQFHPNCKFHTCSHTHEPDCAVIEAVEKGLIDYGRYESYLNILDTLDT